jgi:hypothetical protein
MSLAIDPFQPLAVVFHRRRRVVTAIDDVQKELLIGVITVKEPIHAHGLGAKHHRHVVVIGDLSQNIKGNVGDTPWIQAFATISCSYTVLGLISLPSLFFFKWNFREFRATMPYGLAWFSSMLTLFFCFYETGLVFGSVLQATRGLFSILLGAILVHYGVRGQEAAETTRKDWIRRIVMAVLMIIAVGLYSAGKV